MTSRLERKTSYSILPLLIVVTLLALSSQHGSGATARQDAGSNRVIERGKFRLHKFQEPVGEESYEIARDGDSLVVKSTFALSYLGGKVSNAATLRLKSDLTPIQFEIKGDTSTQSKIDTSVEINNRTVTVREWKKQRQAAAPERFFTTVGYAPITGQMMLARYWSQHKIKGALKTLPAGEVMIERRGRDRIEVAGKQISLDRYSVGGLIWGRETLWLDSENQLVAVVTVDAEFDHFEAVREGYEPALPLFVKKAAQDTIDALAPVSRRITPKQQGTFAIVGGALIDGTGTAPVADSAVVVENGRVITAGPRSQVRIPKGAAIVDARGKSIIPGLWDMHAHYVQVEWGPAYLAAGVTTARDCGNDFDFIVPVRNAIRSGLIHGPRLLLAGYIDGEGPQGLGSIRAFTVEQGRAIVNRYKDAGFEQIKIYGNARMKPEVIAAIIAEAHRLGMTVTGHIPRGMNALQAVEAGFDQINHIGFLFPLLRPKDAPRQVIDLSSAEAKQAIQFFKERGTVIEPTLSRFEFNTHPIETPFSAFEPGAGKAPRELADIFNNTGLPAESAERVRAREGQTYAVVRALHEAGIPIVPGIDLAVPGHSLHRELELYVKAGLTPMQAIQTATITSARAMKLDKELGTIEAGKRADMVILDTSPLEAISNIRKVRWVVSDGKMYEVAPLWQSVGFQP